jgi:hypothetical protein
MQAGRVGEREINEPRTENVSLLKRNYWREQLGRHAHQEETEHVYQHKNLQGN